MPAKITVRLLDGTVIEYEVQDLRIELLAGLRKCRLMSRTFSIWFMPWPVI